MRAFRCRVLKLPNPRISILSPALECADNGFKEGIDDHLTVATCEVSEGGYFVDKISFGRERGPFNQGGAERAKSKVPAY